MTRVLSILLLAVGAGGAAWSEATAAEDWARAMFADREHNFGSVARSAKAEHEFTVVNLYKEPMELLGVRSSCGCTIPRIEGNKRVLQTGEKGAVVARVNSSQFTGHRSATLTVRIGRPKYPRTPPAEVQLQVKVNIRDDVVIEPSAVKFGQIDQGVAYRQTVRVRCRGGHWAPKIEGVTCHHPHLTADIIPQTSDRWSNEYELRVVIDKDAPPGYVVDYLTLTTAGRRNEPIHVRVEGHVMPALQISPSPLLLGTLQPGQAVTRTLVVRGQRPFQITDVRVQGDDLSWRLPEQQRPGKLHVIPFTFTAPEDELGQVSRTVALSTDLVGQPATFSAQAVVSREDAMADSTDGATRHEVTKPARPPDTQR